MRGPAAFPFLKDTAQRVHRPCRKGELWLAITSTSRCFLRLRLSSCDSSAASYAPDRRRLSMSGSRNAAVSGLLVAFVAGAYVYTMKAVGRSADLDAAVAKRAGVESPPGGVKK